MSLVRLQVDQWLIAAREFLTKQEIDNISNILKTRKIKLTHSTFLHYTNEFALLLEKRGNKAAWEITSKITSYYISYHMPIVSNKRPIIMNHFHLNSDNLVPALQALHIGDFNASAEQASSSPDMSKASTSEVDSNRKDDVTKSGTLFPIICKLRSCTVCLEFSESIPVCVVDKCKRKHRGGRHFLSHAQRRKLARLHKFREIAAQNPENGQTSGDTNQTTTIDVVKDTGIKAAEPALDRNVKEGKLGPRKRKCLSWADEVESEQS